MTLVFSYPKMGNLRVFDLNKKIDIHKLRQDFSSLRNDKYVKEGFRKKHIVRYKYQHPNKYIKKPLEPLYQSSDTNPTHGGIIREYPEYNPKHQDEFIKMVNTFVELSSLKHDDDILIQAQRITCDVNTLGFPSVENWHRDSVTKIGILCIDRFNIDGGINEFRMNSNQDNIIQFNMYPGFFVVFDDDDIMHRVSEIASENKRYGGYRDVMLFSYPDCSIKK